ncbi:Sec63 Brl domain containing protein [Amanita muscaria]
MHMRIYANQRRADFFDMDHHYLPGHHQGYRVCYGNNDTAMNDNDLLSDIEDFSDELNGNLEETFIPSSSAPGQGFQHFNSRSDLYYAHDAMNFQYQQQENMQGYHDASSYQPQLASQSRMGFQERQTYRPSDHGQSHPRRAQQSQRYSMPVGNDYEEESSFFESRDLSNMTRGRQLRPVSQLRYIFKFGVFNAVQSACFDTVFHSDQNVIISGKLKQTSEFNKVISEQTAPTGSGKTVLFELAIIRLLHHAKESGRVFKCVYVSPTKALCAERCRDWNAKFGTLGIKCCELTGDTAIPNNSVWGDAKKASIIITTAEKWDSLTRTWRDQDQVLSQIKLFLVDEVHVLNEARGSTLEVVISRMKTRGINVRFVMVSATVPNIEDVAAWIGTSGVVNAPSAFGEEYRPCKLSRTVVGVPRPKGLNEFAFAKMLDGRLFSVLQSYSVGKPILIFCPTRNGVFATAEQLKKDYFAAESKRQDLPWKRMQQSHHSFCDKRVNELASVSIGVHHAGLAMEDRRSVEDQFVKGILQVMVATSTLAVGVNLPAHTVVIKGVHLYQNGANVEYSDLDIMQMIGRAVTFHTRSISRVAETAVCIGPPPIWQVYSNAYSLHIFMLGIDTEGLAIILCESTLEHKYKALAQGATIIESSLHRNLVEHLNSEVSLGTIASINLAKDWLRSSFLFQRIRKNPNHYALGKEENQTWEERMDDLVVQSFSKLSEMNLIELINGGEEVRSTEYGNIMSKMYIRQYTVRWFLMSRRETDDYQMDLVLKLTEKPSVRDILETVSLAEEFQELRIRTSDKTSLNKLRQHNDIRYGVKKIEKTSDKVFIIIQAVLGGISLNSPEYRTSDNQPHLEALAIFRHVGRIVRAIVEVAIVRQRGAQMKHALELLRCLTARAWDDRPIVLRQIEQIGEKSLKVLAENRISSFHELRKQDPMRIEQLLNRRPPFGQEIIASAKDMPQYSLAIEETYLGVGDGREPIEVELSIRCGLVETVDKVKFKKLKRREANITVVYTVTSDMEFVDFRRIPTKSLQETKCFNIAAKLSKPSQSIVVTISSENVAGVAVQKLYKPDIAPSEFPVLDTRPPAALIKVEQPMADQQSTIVSAKDFAVSSVSQDLEGIKDERTPTLHVKDIRGGSKVLQNLNKPDSKNKVLPNGNYDCKEGLSKPPKNQGRTNLASNTKQSKAGENEKLSRYQKDPGVVKQRSHPILADLEVRHACAEVEKGLRITNGQRIRLSAQGTKLSSKQITDHNNSRNRDSTLSGKVNRTNSVVSLTSGSDYSDPEVDSIIRALPLDRDETMETPRPTPQAGELYSESQVSAQPKKRKAPLFLEEINSSKKVKCIDELPKLKSQNEDPVQTHAIATAGKSTFHEYHTISSPESDDIEIVDLNAVHHDSIETSAQPTTAVEQNTNSVDEFAELDAWLNSGAVDILYD